jgi:hypothetical protein
MTAPLHKPINKYITMPQAFIIVKLPQLRNAKLWRLGEAQYFQMEESEASANLQEIHGIVFSTCGL